MDHVARTVAVVLRYPHCLNYLLNAIDGQLHRSEAILLRGETEAICHHLQVQWFP